MESEVVLPRCAIRTPRQIGIHPHTQHTRTHANKRTHADTRILCVFKTMNARMHAREATPQRTVSQEGEGRISERGNDRK